MQDIIRAMSACLPFCHNRLTRDDEELESLPPADVQAPAQDIPRPPPTAISAFHEMVNKRLLNLQQRRQLVEAEFQPGLDQEIRDAKNLGAIAEQLLEGADQTDSAVQLFSKISTNIQRHELLRYDSTALHNVYALASHKAGDCESICKLYAFAAWAAGYKDIALKQLKGDFKFELDQDGVMPGRRKGDAFNFVLHTVLQVNDSDGRPAYFDPLFGQCVDISAYGHDLNHYMGGAEGSTAHRHAVIDNGAEGTPAVSLTVPPQ
ncbi:hypothetical protein [Pseudomonas typographi]|uniref:Peptidase C58 YopT-type domain-containing protein n=1 Tax=Pseudomonas typographi TaxID=2715964 RepID=A0ABR7Z2M3_9PSED|nr:hypothetical protein [Pseudomonas typographi]MBD1599617.1 hypothetical protein [Pseudomonas typographi]